MWLTDTREESDTLLAGALTVWRATLILEERAEGVVAFIITGRAVLIIVAAILSEASTPKTSVNAQ